MNKIKQRMFEVLRELKYAPYLPKILIGLVVDSGREICGAAEAYVYRLMKLFKGAYVDVLGVQDKIISKG